MSRPVRRSPTLPLAILAAGVALALSGCITPPPLPTTAPTTPAPTTSPDPVETSTAPTPQPSAEGGLPELVAIGTPLPEGTLGGWETSIITDEAFVLQDDSDFPAGPTISVVEAATDCSFWAYQGTQDGDSTDEAENSAVTLGILSDTDPGDWDADRVTLEPSASQGVSVEMLSIVHESEDGAAEAWFARNFQSGGMTSSIVAKCPAGAGGVDHIDEVVLEHFQISFLVP